MQQQNVTEQDNFNLKNVIEYDQSEKINSMPLQFQYVPVEILSKQFTKLNSEHNHKIHYLGPRFLNTLSLHKKFSFNEFLPYYLNSNVSIYPNIQKYKMNNKKIVQSYFMAQKLKNNHFYKSALYYRAFQGMNPSLNSTQQYIFNSAFESGNLDCTIKVNPQQFDLFLRIDSNTRGHTQWFYFSIKNGNKRQKIRLNICNLTKPRTLYQSGMKPYVYSEKQFQNNFKVWEQGGQNIQLSQKQLRYQFLYDKTNVPRLYCLTLEYQFQFADDEVFFAYCIPYTYSQMQRQINLLPQNYVKVENLGRSLCGLEIPVLHITNHSIAKQKRNIVITGRVHPGQSNSSHMLFGFINFLCSNKKQAQQLRNRINFIIIPMSNPDGVVLGNSRTSASGKDLNRQYAIANKDLYPQVYLIKNLIKKIHYQYGVFLYFDFHGHSRKKNTFFYGPAYSVNQPDYYKCRILPKLIQKVNNSFRFYSCSFNISQEKKSAARAVMFQQLKIPFTYTVETSIGYFYDCEKLQVFQFTQKYWRQTGAAICQGTSSFFVGLEDFQQMIKQRRAERQKLKKKALGNFRSIKRMFADQQTTQQNQRQSTLKIFYEQNTQFMQLFEQLKRTSKMQEQTKGIDDELSSDDHDDKQDLQTSKLKQFNNLLIQTAKKDTFVSKFQVKVKNNLLKDNLVRQNSLHKQDQLDFIKQINMKKPKTSHTPRQKLLISKEKKQYKQSFAKSTNVSLKQTPRDNVQSFTVNKERIKTTKSIQKNFKLNEEISLKTGTFNELTFPDSGLQLFEQPRFIRTSIFRKDRAINKRNQKSTTSASHFSHTQANQQQNKKQQKQFSISVIKNTKKVTPKVKFEDVIENINNQSRMLKQSIKRKGTRSGQCYSVFPSSFYAIKQHYDHRRKVVDAVVPVAIDFNSFKIKSIKH